MYFHAKVMAKLKELVLILAYRLVILRQQLQVKYD